MAEIKLRTIYLHKKEKQEIKKDHRYNSRSWRKYSLIKRMTISKCELTGDVYHYTKLVVDHIIPVSQEGSFWDERNHQIISIFAHNEKTAKEKKGSKTPWKLNEEGERIPS